MTDWNKRNGGFLDDFHVREFQVSNLSQQIDKLKQELQRKDNIINELEEWLEEQHQFIIEIPAFTKDISNEHKTMELCYEDVLDKLKELENSGSDE